MSIKYKNLDETKAFKALKKQAETVVPNELLNPEGIKKSNIPAGGGLHYNYAAKRMDNSLIDLLQDLAEEQQLIEKYKALLAGELVNTGEKRMVLHQLTRGQLNGPVEFKGTNQRHFYKEQAARMEAFSRKIHSGEIKGSTGKKFDTVIQIGIGGSDLGPRALYLALEHACPLLMKGYFISNVDPDDANGVLKGIDFETSLFILVSKSGTTQETLANRNLVLEKAKAAGIKGYKPSAHIVAVTSQTSPLADSPDVLDSFYMDDFIGGRYSSTSAVGGVILSLAFGFPVFQEILDGAAESDKLSLNRDIRSNAALMDAMIGLYERNVLNYPVTAVLPYSQGLSRFPAHLQQLDMESNGKSVNRQGEPVNYKTGPVIFGEPGTNGQHSFYQHLHQGTDIIPLQFIGFRESQMEGDRFYEGSSSQDKLKANLAAQITAFATGKPSRDKNKNFQGGRPSSLIVGERLTPEALGALLAHFENKVMFQGFCWNINSFDQEGVQLGKILAKEVLGSTENMNPVLKAYAQLLASRKLRIF